MVWWRVLRHARRDLFARLFGSRHRWSSCESARSAHEHWRVGRAYERWPMH